MKPVFQVSRMYKNARRSLPDVVAPAEAVEFALIFVKTGEIQNGPPLSGGDPILFCYSLFFQQSSEEVCIFPSSSRMIPLPSTSKESSR